MHGEMSVPDEQAARHHDQHADERAADPWHQPAKSRHALDERFDAKEDANEERRDHARNDAEKGKEEKDLTRQAVAVLDRNRKRRVVAEHRKRAENLFESEERAGDGRVERRGNRRARASADEDAHPVGAKTEAAPA